MSRASLTELVGDYVHDPRPERLRRLRSAVTGSPTFDPGLDLVAVAGAALEEGRIDDAIRGLTSKMPGAALSPSAHAVLAAAFEAKGDEAAARRERLMAELSVTTILSTGDGTREHPWSVLRVADEYDLLRTRGVTSVEQLTLTEGGRLVDGHVDEDGNQLWFAVETRRSLEGGVRS